MQMALSQGASDEARLLNVGRSYNGGVAISQADRISAAEDAPEQSHMLVEAPSAFSDAIEDELRQLEAGYPPTVRSRFLGVVRGVAKLAGFLVRPESMTAYATLAAALAAFLAVKAAERQEKATFTSTLYSKQVDALASFETKFRRFIVAGSPFYNIKKRDKKAVDFTNLSVAYEEMNESLYALDIVYPAEAGRFVDGIRIFANTRIDMLKKVWDNTPIDPQKFLPALNTNERNLSNDVFGIVLCSIAQLRDGSYIHGSELNLCILARRTNNQEQSVLRTNPQLPIFRRPPFPKE